MSFSKNDQILPPTVTDKELAFLIQKILRQEYKNRGSAVKRIANKTGLELRTIRNWYEGRKAPKSVHLLLLASHYQEVLHLVIKLIGRSDLWAVYEQNISLLNVAVDTAENPSSEKIYSAKSCTINVTIDTEKARALNQRQLWYLGLVQQGHKIKATDIMVVWDVSARTAKYDMEGLVDLDLIHFVGARKTGYYAAI